MSDSIPTISRHAAQDSTASLLSRLGGEAAVTALTGALYFNILRDPRLTPFFADSDVDAIRQHQQLFLTMVLGGPDSYRGRDLGDAHRALVRHSGLSQIHFDAMTAVLASTLAQFGHSTDLSLAIVERVSALSAEVLGVSTNPVKPTE